MVNNRAVLGIDIGGTKIAGALFDFDGNIISDLTYSIDGKKGEEVGDLTVTLINKLIHSASQKGLISEAIGVAVPGIYKSRSGLVWAPNIPGWDNYPLKDTIISQIDSNLVLEIDSDRSCYILGEVWKGVAKGCKNAIFLAVGTGIGAGILAEGRVLRGTEGIAGAVGWLAISKPYLPQYKYTGCFEYHASGKGMVSIVKQLILERDGYLEVPGKGKIKNITTGDVFSAFDKDPVAKEVISEAIECWGKAVANLVSIFDPEIIIFGGGVFGPAIRFLNEIFEEAKKWAQPVSIKKTRLKGSVLKGYAGLYGAGYLAIDKINGNRDG